MNIVDAVLIVLLIIGIMDGIRLGAVRSFVGFFGTILVFLLSWILKGTLADVMIKTLPQLGGNAAISVLIYHVIAFIILLIIFSVIYRVILKLTNVVEKVMDATIILGFVSRIIGGAFGFIKMYILLFIVLFILSIFNFSFMKSSKVNRFILDKTPLLAPIVEDTWNGIKGVYEASNVEEAIRSLFENNIITEENMNKLLNGGN